MPSEHVGTEPISIAEVTGGSQELTLLEAKVSLTGKEWQKHPIVTGPEVPCILGIDFLRNSYYKDPKGLRWAFRIAAVEAEGIKKINALPGLSENPSAVGLLKAVRKSDGEWRLTVDYRAVNEVTPPLSGAVLDMLELQNKLESKAAKCPTICHGLIQPALEKGEALEHLQYIDDIIVRGNMAMEVFEKGEKIIQILLKAGFATKKSKVKGHSREIQFLRIKWQDGWRQILTEVINKITATSPRTIKKKTQAFLGAIGFWRMHIPEYSPIVSPLYLVTGKKNDFHWGPEQQQAFAQIKQENAPAVALGAVRTGPDVKNVLYSAAGNNGLSWSLWQKVPGETWGRPLGFWSQSYRGSKTNYTPTEREILATYEGVQATSGVTGTEAQLLLAP
ncbi:hypothetical protein DUI87_20544 [Hirundo rustica rustica]|uniref:Reverse transcriptase/retrotransposon-derived protein RNase H-like domain-containing protein n=1 Tax=Hirundo rustica rustica TaxID=333673 RepID=A0A3M0JQP9_HIRRU|nr:hypothetical protein DUI87_20544 [Hirundo rustica rustica]